MVLSIKTTNKMYSSLKKHWESWDLHQADYFVSYS